MAIYIYIYIYICRISATCGKEQAELIAQQVEIHPGGGGGYANASEARWVFALPKGDFPFAEMKTSLHFAKGSQDFNSFCQLSLGFPH